MAWTPTFTAERFTNQTNLLNGIDSRRLFNADGKIHQLDPRQAPLLTMLFAKLPEVGVNDPDFKYYEERPYWTDKYLFYAAGSPANTMTSAAVGASTGAWAVEATVGGSDNVGFLKVGMIFRVIDATDGVTEAQFRITTVTNQQSIVAELLTASPGFQPADGDTIKVVGNSHAEGGSKTTNVSFVTEAKWGSTQIFKNLVSMSNSAINTQLLGNQMEWDRQKGIALKVLWSDIERELLFGVRNASVAGNPFSQPNTYNNTATTGIVRSTVGIRQAVQWANTNGFGNTTIFSPVMEEYSYGALIDDMEQAFYFGSDTKVAMCGRGVISYFNKLAIQDSSLQINQRATEFGFSIYEIITAHGMLKLIAHPFLTGKDAYRMFLIDMDNLSLQMFRNLTLQEHVETPGDDKREDQWLIDVGLQVKLPETMSYWNFV